MFLNSIMLVGIGAAVVPWVLHLLSRSRYKDVDWGAMMFLEAAQGSPRQSNRMSQALLMLLRMSAVALLAVALARPVLLDGFAAPSKGQPVIAVILLDCSARMNAEENGQTRMVLARAQARQVLERHKGDRVSLVLMGQKQSRAERAPTADLWDVARRIDSAEAGSGNADVARSLTESAEFFAGASDAGPHVGSEPFLDFYIIGGREASAWRGITSSFHQEFTRQLKEVTSAFRLFVVPIGGADTNAFIIESVDLVNPPAIVDQPAEFEIKLRNFGSVRWAALPLSITTISAERASERGERSRTRISEQTINLPPRSEAIYRASATFRTTGPQIISATVRPAAASLEERLEAAVPVDEPTSVLIITGESMGGGTDDKSAEEAGATGAAACLGLALAPFKAAHQPGADACKVEIVSAEGWSGSRVVLPGSSDKRPGDERQLSKYRVLVLSNVERFSPSQAVALEQFVYDGGGLLIAPGPLSRAADYNDSLFRDGAGILPASLADPKNEEDAEQTAISGADLSHPVFRFLASRPDLFLATTIDRYFPVLTHAAGARDLAHYVSGDPFMIESTSGKGRVLLMTTSLGTEWTALPVSNFYLPFVQSAVRYLADSKKLRLNLRPGEPIEVPIDESAEIRGVEVTTPVGEQKPAELLHTGNQTVARFTDTDVPGAYVVKVVGPAKAAFDAFAVQASLEDSNPSPLGIQQWTQLLEAGGIEELELRRQSGSEPPSASESGRHELWRWALGGVLVLSLAEMAVARASANRTV